MQEYSRQFLHIVLQASLQVYIKINNLRKKKYLRSTLIYEKLIPDISQIEGSF